MQDGSYQQVVDAEIEATPDWVALDDRPDLRYQLTAVCLDHVVDASRQLIRQRFRTEIQTDIPDEPQRCPFYIGSADTVENPQYETPWFRSSA